MKWLHFLFLFSFVGIFLVPPTMGETENDTEWVEKGIILFDLSKYNEALSAFSKATRINSTDDLAWTGKGYALFQLGYFEEASVAFEKATEINPGNINAQTGKVNVISAQYLNDIKKNRQELMNDLNSTTRDNAINGAEEFIKTYRESIGLSTSA